MKSLSLSNEIIDSNINKLDQFRKLEAFHLNCATGKRKESPWFTK